MKKEIGDPGLAKRALDEHRDIQKSVKIIAIFVKGGPRHTSEDIRALIRYMKSLREHLVSHFKLEEGEGLFDDILERLPTADADLQNLQREHATFLEDVESLTYRIEQRTEDKLEDVREDLGSFVRAFLAHEKLENELLQRAFCRDMGAPD